MDDSQQIDKANIITEESSEFRIELASLVDL